MVHPLEDEDDQADVPALPVHAMSPAELAEVLEQIAHQQRQLLGEEGVGALLVAAQHLSTGPGGGCGPVAKGRSVRQFRRSHPAQRRRRGGR
jgi:hypothetical protein